jgi:hypothetical protein
MAVKIDEGFLMRAPRQVKNSVGREIEEHEICEISANPPVKLP